MAYDPPKLGGYTFQNPPNSMTIYPEVIQQVNELADGSMKQRILGYRIKATLDWSESWIRSQDLTGIMAVANDASATLAFVPRSTTKPALSYSVIWTNKFQFAFMDGHYGVYGGSIELTTVTPTATITDLP